MTLFFQVDDRLNGDGTGLPFGVNDPVSQSILRTVPVVKRSALGFSSLLNAD